MIYKSLIDQSKVEDLIQRWIKCEYHNECDGLNSLNQQETEQLHQYLESNPDLDLEEGGEEEEEEEEEDDDHVDDDVERVDDL